MGHLALHMEGLKPRGLAGPRTSWLSQRLTDCLAAFLVCPLRVAFVPRQDALEGGEQVVEAVGNDDVVIDGHKGGDNHHGDSHTWSEREKRPDHQETCCVSELLGANLLLWKESIVKTEASHLVSSKTCKL